MTITGLYLLSICNPGVSSPVVGIAGCIAISLNILVLLWSMGLLKETAQERGHAEYVHILNEDVKRFVHLLPSAMMFLPIVAALFYSPFLFDLMADAAGQALGSVVASCLSTC